jgi:hypothetical protein
MLIDLIRAAIRQPDVSVSELMRTLPLPAPDGLPCLSPADSRSAAESIRARLLESHEVSQAAVFIDDHGELPVRAHVAGQGLHLTELHESMLLASAANPRMRLPSMYRQVGLSPADPTSEASWLNMAATASLQPATDYQRTARDDERIQLMVAAFERCHPEVTCDPARCYAQAGGDYLMVPAMLAELDQAGLAGAEPADFVGLASLAAIARRLTLGDLRQTSARRVQL